MNTQQIDDLVNHFAAAKKKMQEDGQAILRQCFKDFFEANPEVGAFRWTQYTPYFNDGEACYFSVHDMYWYPASSEEFAGDPEEEAVSTYWSESAYALESLQKYHPEVLEKTGGADAFRAVQPKVAEFVKAIKQLPDEVFEDTFGDHVEIIATREGFDVEEYSHD